MQIVLFDDAGRENFFPLTINRSTGELLVGAMTLIERLDAYFGCETTLLIVDSELAALCAEKHPGWTVNTLTGGDTLFVNTRLKIDDDLADAVRLLASGQCLTAVDTIIAARLDVSVGTMSAENLTQVFAGCEKRPIERDNVLWNALWEMVIDNGEWIRRDFEDFYYEKDNKLETEPGVTVLNPYDVWIGEGTRLLPGVVIDASGGPVIIREDVTVMPNTVITGPVYVGTGSTIRALAKIYGDTSVGPVCKIGGEVGESIVLGYSNKQHDGFLGHSYLGEWINLGADTNNSDLKNNYKPVDMWFYPAGAKVTTGCQFAGCIIGDHSKTGINCTINTGTVIGVGCNLFGPTLIRDFIPSFSWGEYSCYTRHQCLQFLETARIVMARRNLHMGEAEHAFWTALHHKEAGE